MRVFAISDLHLGFGVSKPMDIFGPQWEGHADKIRKSWDARITAEDWVLVGGDTSWGLSLAEAQPDLDWLGERPGQKILIKGNHCTWWSSLAKVRAALADTIHPLQNNAIRMPDGTVVIGARLWDPPEAPWADDRARRIFERELGRLQMSIDAGRQLDPKRTIALVHYPPKFSDGRETAVVPLLKKAGVTHCIYGHLHGKDLKYGFQGEADGIRYLLVSCDNIDFQPLEIELSES